MFLSLVLTKFGVAGKPDISIFLLPAT